MSLFPADRHENQPLWYRFNIVLIILGFFNVMAYPAYGEIDKMNKQRQLEARLISEISYQQGLAETLEEMKKLLTVLTPSYSSRNNYVASTLDNSFDLIIESDPVLKQGKTKQRQRLNNLIAVLPEKYGTELQQLVDYQTELQQQNNPALQTVITEITQQINTLENNYLQLQSLIALLNRPSGKSTAGSSINNESSEQLLALLDTFDTAPQQQTQTGPSNIVLDKDQHIHKDVRTQYNDFAEEQAISRQQLNETIEPLNWLPAIQKNATFSAKKRPPPYSVGSLSNTHKYRGESDEIKLTKRIKDKAEELDYDPVKIYYWVRNHIEFVPTWGAYQTAEHTLGSRQGNAVDTASLLIALLRASNIPARYVHGTIRIEPDTFQNWIGDFADVRSATDYAYRQGLRAVSLYQRPANNLIGIEVEHIWVEAAIDFHPSRGMANKAADTWLPLDASFKQYDYLDGLDVEKIGGIDPDKLLKDFEASGTSNESEGWTQGFDASIIEKAQTDAQKKLETHIKTMTDPTVGDVIGGNKVIVKEYPVLSAGLSNHIVVRGTDYIKIPRNYQAQIGLAMRPVTKSGIINIPQPPIDNALQYYPLSQFNSEKTLLRFTPATQADKDALAALVPANATSIDDLPKFIGSGIKVIPELWLNGKVILTGSPMKIGSEVTIGYKPRLPNSRQNHPAMAYDVIAGSYLHIPIVGYSVNPYQLIDTRKRVEETQKILNSNNQTQIAKLTREDILGDLFYTGGLGYFAQLHTMNRMLSQQGDAIGMAPTGYGSYGYEPKLKQAGILATPVGITPGSIATNIRVHQGSWRKATTTKPNNNMSFAMGMNSSILESAISEQLFCNKEMNPNNKPCYGISTVSGLQRAAAQGQKIYQIDRNNKAQLANIQMSEKNMSNDINKSVNSGGYVIVPEKTVEGTGRNAIYVYMTHNGNGTQGWKISGGLNGGTLADLSNDVYYAAYAVDLLDAISSVADANGWGSNALGGIFSVLGVFMDLASAVTTIADIARNYPGGLDNPAVREAMDSIIALTIIAITMTAMLGILGVLGGPVGGVIFAVMSNVMSAMFNRLIKYEADLVKNRC